MSLRVLIVEDEALIAMDLTDILEEGGHTVVGVAATTKDAITLASSAVPFDLAIMDIDLAGGGDGIATAGRLRDEFGIQALFVSARTDQEERVRALTWTPLGFLAKPYLARQVLDAIATASE